MSGSQHNDIGGQEFAAARALLVIEQYDGLKHRAHGICTIVPLKGVSLLKGIYRDNLDRDAGDIDILVYPASKAAEFVDRLIKAGYTRQFNYLSDTDALSAKRKIALLGRGPLETDIDIHLDLVTKRFFRKTCGRFNEDAISRCIPAGDSEARLDKIDEWLFLSQHACFHRFQEGKWLRDLQLTAETFSADEFLSLTERAKRYGMYRIMQICCNELIRNDMDVSRHRLKTIIGTHRNRFYKRVKHILLGRHSKPMKRIISWLWEIFCIDSTGNRLKAYCHYILPRQNDMKAIYRTDSDIKAMLLRVPHAIVSAITVLTFAIYLCVVSLKPNSAPR